MIHEAPLALVVAAQTTRDFYIFRLEFLQAPYVAATLLVERCCRFLIFGAFTDTKSTAASFAFCSLHSLD